MNTRLNPASISTDDDFPDFQFINAEEKSDNRAQGTTTTEPTAHSDRNIKDQEIELVKREDDRKRKNNEARRRFDVRQRSELMMAEKELETDLEPKNKRLRLEAESLELRIEKLKEAYLDFIRRNTS